ncbi:MAG: hypothetical protein JWQ53_2703 [Klenkia sp.]|nr:hypothetical protein [Klenkia sp.]
MLRAHHGRVTTPTSGRTAASAAKTALAARLAADPGVVGVGVARRASQYVVRVDLVDGDAGGAVPGVVDGVPVVTRVTGRVRAL